MRVSGDAQIVCVVTIVGTVLKYCFCKKCAQAEVVAMTIQGMFVRYVKAIDCKKHIIVYFYLV